MTFVTTTYESDSREIYDGDRRIYTGFYRIRGRELKVHCNVSRSGKGQ